MGKFVPKSGEGYPSEYYGETRMHGDEKTVDARQKAPDLRVRGIRNAWLRFLSERGFV